VPADAGSRTAHLPVIAYLPLIDALAAGPRRRERKTAALDRPLDWAHKKVPLLIVIGTGADETAVALRDDGDRD
jgi:hypothetical protein